MNRKFKTHVNIVNNTGVSWTYNLRKEVVAYIELTPTNGGHKLHFALNQGDYNDDRFEANELVQKCHLLQLESLRKTNLLQVVEGSESENFTDSLADSFSVAFAKNLTVVMTDNGGDLKIDIMGNGYSSTITIHDKDIPKWAFSRKSAV